MKAINESVNPLNILYFIGLASISKNLSDLDRVAWMHEGVNGFLASKCENMNTDYFGQN